MAIPEHLKNRVNNNNNDKINQILELNEKTVPTVEESTDKGDNIATPSLDSLFSKKKKKRATNIYLSEDVYNKIVTLSMEHGESLTSTMETIISASVQNVKIKQHLVREYNNKMEKKRKPKNTNKQSTEE